MPSLELTWDEARSAAYGSVTRLSSVQVGLSEAHGRVLAESVTALTPLPPMLTSAMDGWAVAGGAPWSVLGQVLAGSTWPLPLTSGQAVAIATGAAVPAGADGVLRREDGLVDSSGLLRGTVRDGRDIRPVGQEAGAGEILIPAGSVLTPVRVGLAAAAGHDHVEVSRRPSAHLLILGDELLERGPSVGGRVRDSLGPQLPGWLARMGVDHVGTAHVEDTQHGLASALDSGDEADLVITTGGTAAGPVDHLHAAIATSRGDLVVDTVACRPGHPMLLARWSSGRRLIGLPGNPLAAIVALLTLGQPLIAGLTGRPLDVLPTVPLGGYVGARGAKTRLVPARLDGGRAIPMSHIGSGMLRGLADADGFAVVSSGGGEPGATARWLAIP